MHIFPCTLIYLRVTLLIDMYFNIRRYFMYVMRSLNVRLIADLHRGCNNFHTSGRKRRGTWKWLATWGEIYYNSWLVNQPSGNGDYLYVWNRHTPAWGTWDDAPDLKECFVCERRIKVPSYCSSVV